VGAWDGSVVAASEEASAYSVRPGIPVRQAQQRCPQATVYSPDPELSQRLQQLIASALYDLAPVVEVRLDGVALLDLAGVPNLRDAVREARLRLKIAAQTEPRLGFAPGPFAARMAAMQAAPGRLFKVDSAPEFLAPLPISTLDLDQEQTERLDLLGLRTLGAVAQVGPRRLESQLGPAGRRAVLLARGEEPEWLDAWMPPKFTSAHRQLEPAVEDREALLFVARGLCEDLGRELGLRGAGAKKVRVKLVTESGPEQRESLVRHTLSSGPELFGLVSSWLKEWRPRAPIIELRIELPELEPAGRRQLRLWVGGDGTSDEVEAALERLQERHGDEAVVKPHPALVGSPVPAQRFAWDHS
jgi:nucleotidyltransferase/DNA polymerase involved in DNA repair